MLGFNSDKQGRVAIATFLLFAVSFFLGGASRLHEFRLAIVELASLPLLLLALAAIPDVSRRREHRLALSLVTATAALPLVQLIPLPPAVWSALPGRQDLALTFAITGLPETWLPLSLTPDKTWRSFLALMPPIAMFLALMVSTAPQRSRLVQALLVCALLGMVLGANQFVSGGERFYPWATTDAGNFTGFFANRNHMATLCLIGIPFAVVLAAGAIRRGGPKANQAVWFGILYIASATVAVGVIQSRSGIILFLPVLIASLLAVWVASGRGRPRPAVLALIGGVTVAVVGIAIFAAGRLLARFDTGGAIDPRFQNWPTVLEAAERYLPFGSGLGSFDAVYRSVEPLERLDATFFNQAHNEYLETLLETGWLGVILIVLFMVWFTRRAWTAWCASISSQRDLQRAATIAIGTLLMHSAADYPLRTVTMATIFALCCGLLELATRTDEELATERSRSRSPRSRVRD